MALLVVGIIDFDDDGWLPCSVGCYAVLVTMRATATLLCWVFASFGAWKPSWVFSSVTCIIVKWLPGSCRRAMLVVWLLSRWLIPVVTSVQPLL